MINLSLERKVTNGLNIGWGGGWKSSEKRYCQIDISIQNLY